MYQMIIAVFLALGITMPLVYAQSDINSADCLPNRDIIYTSDASGAYYELYQLRIPEDQTAVGETRPLLFGVPELSQGMVDSAPRWSPDGQLIAFMSSRQGNYDIFFGWQADDRWKLMVLDAKSQDEALPDWSPDSETLAYTVLYENNEELVTTSLREVDTTRLTNNPARDFYPSWSPDGTRIAFVSDRDGNPDIFILNLADTSTENLTKSDTEEYSPDWSPDAKWIAFESHASGRVQIWTLDVETGDMQQVTDKPGVMSSPQWSPDGQYLIVMGQNALQPDWDLYLITVETGEIRLLTDNDTNDMFPSWRICAETNVDQ